MSKLKDKMKGKVKLDDLNETKVGDVVTSPYDTKPSSGHGDKAVSSGGDLSPNTQSDKPTKQHVTKSRLTVYLDPETEALFNKMYADKIVKGEKVDKSSMICEAVRLLYDKWSD